MKRKERNLEKQLLLKKQIISTAKDIGYFEGWDQVTIRKIAHKIEYTAPIIYEYFTNKDELFQEIRREGYQKLLSKYQAVLTKANSPTEILTQFAIAYLNFAWENPELYTLMYCVDHSSLGNKGLEEEINQIRTTIKTNLIRSITHDTEFNLKLTSIELNNNIDILRSMLHGTITLFKMGVLQGDETRAKSLALQGVQDLVTHWITQQNNKKN